MMGSERGFAVALKGRHVMSRIMPRIQRWLSGESSRPAIDYALFLCILLIFFLIVVAMSNGGLDRFFGMLAERVADAIR